LAFPFSFLFPICAHCGASGFVGSRPHSLAQIFWGGDRGRGGFLVYIGKHKGGIEKKKGSFRHSTKKKKPKNPPGCTSLYCFFFVLFYLRGSWDTNSSGAQAWEGYVKSPLSSPGWAFFTGGGGKNEKGGKGLEQLKKGRFCKKTNPSGGQEHKRIWVRAVPNPPQNFGGLTPNPTNEKYKKHTEQKNQTNRAFVPPAVPGPTTPGAGCRAAWVWGPLFSGGAPFIQICDEIRNRGHTIRHRATSNNCFFDGKGGELVGGGVLWQGASQALGKFLVVYLPFFIGEHTALFLFLSGF